MSGSGEVPAELEFQRVKSTYTIAEICKLFGLSPRFVRRWTRQGIVESIGGEDEDVLYGFRALTIFRRIREMRSAGMTPAQIETQISGQLNLFGGGQGKLIELPRKLTYFEQGLVLHEKRDPRAMDFYRESIRSGEHVADAYCNLGILEFEADRWIKAADCFTLSLKADPRHFESHFNLANLYFDARDMRLARLHYEIAREIEASYAPLHFNLALVHIEQDDADQALISLEQCRALTPDADSGQIDEMLRRLRQYKASEA
jgi:tetratricopeptide (TPR) repeat protein